jgi:Ca2+-transporting ATPase
MAGIIAGSVAGWSPIERNYDNNEALFSRDTGRSQLGSSEEVEIHPGTKPDDPVITESPHDLHAPPSQIDNVTPAAAGQGHSTHRQDDD